jgi:glycosyltransferase involved in cell wall biosynthesis
VDIVIPVFNEEREIVSTLAALERSVRTPFRVLICYDTDDDRTLPAVDRFRAGRPIDVSLVKNAGTGVHAAVVSGLRASTAPAVIVMPADDSYNTGQIDRMVDLSRQGCEVVCASRFIDGGTMEGCRWSKGVLVRVTAFTLFHCARLPSRDATNGFRLFSRRLLRNVRIESSEGFAYSLELLVKCHRLGWKIGEVPALWFERTGRASRFRIVSWAPGYLRWYWYAFETTYLRKGPKTVSLPEEATL